MASSSSVTRLLDDCDTDVDWDEFGVIDDQSAVVTYTGTLSAKHWREYLEEKWEKFQRGLIEVRLLIICGVHGGSNGLIPGSREELQDHHEGENPKEDNSDAENFKDCVRHAVSLTILHPAYM